ncbi:MAG: hypothetical protein V4480_04020 [Patescibacteria group bacterium]
MILLAGGFIAYRIYSPDSEPVGADTSTTPRHRSNPRDFFAWLGRLNYSIIALIAALVFVVYPFVMWLTSTPVQYTMPVQTAFVQQAARPALTPAQACEAQPHQSITPPSGDDWKEVKVPWGCVVHVDPLPDPKLYRVKCEDMNWQPVEKCGEYRSISFQRTESNTDKDFEIDVGFVLRNN